MRHGTAPPPTTPPPHTPVYTLHFPGIKLPHLTLVVKNLDRYFSFEVSLLDDMNIRRRFRASNFQVGGLGAAGIRY